MVISPGQSASVQCNGVREARPYDGNTAKDYCNVKLSYRAADPRPRRPSAPRWVAASARTGPWTGVPICRAIVSGNAQNWTAQARAAGRPVSKTPSAGSVMVLQGGVMGAFTGTGHVAYVESVNATSFVVSEQNWNGIRYSTTRTIQISSLPATGVDFIG